MVETRGIKMIKLIKKLYYKLLIYIAYRKKLKKMKEDDPYVYK